jgi:hypothetical protein
VHHLGGDTSHVLDRQHNHRLIWPTGSQTPLRVQRNDMSGGLPIEDGVQLGGDPIGERIHARHRTEGNAYRFCRRGADIFAQLDISGGTASRMRCSMARASSSSSK